jgi:HEAT repeat protein
VRLAVVFSLPTTPDGVAALVRLTGDPDLGVRSWATFELGAAEVDGEAVREAFVARLADVDPEVRGEALMGLARRKDPRTRAALDEELARWPHDDLALDAARELADPALLPRLLALQSSERRDPWSNALEVAIEALQVVNDQR